MFKRGIDNGTYDVHVAINFPDKVMYVFRCDNFHKIKHELVFKVGHSKNDVPTGRGYLLPKKHEIVTAQKIPLKIFDAEKKKMQAYQDREWGKCAERIFRSWCPEADKTWVTEASRQLTLGYDCIVDGLRVEVKGENFVSGNIFVQTHEQGHSPLLLADGKTTVYTQI